MKTTAAATKALITRTIKRGVALSAHKGDLQDMVWSALGRSLSLDEAAYASRALEATGYEAPPGFKRDVPATVAKAA